jgi:hypothetical protein
MKIESSIKTRRRPRLGVRAYRNHSSFLNPKYPLLSTLNPFHLSPYFSDFCFLISALPSSVQIRQNPFMSAGKRQAF